MHNGWGIHMMHNDWAQLGLVPPSSAQSTLLVIKCFNVEKYLWEIPPFRRDLGPQIKCRLWNRGTSLSQSLSPMSAQSTSLVINCSNVEKYYLLHTLVKNVQYSSKVRLSRCIHESRSFGGGVTLAQGSLCPPPSTTPRQRLMDTRGRSPLDKRRRFTKGGALMPTIEPIYLVDPPEQPQQQQPQSRIQRQRSSEDLTQSLGLHSHQQPQPQPQPQKSSEDLTETCTQDETWEERWKRELDEESSIEEDTQQYCMRILTQEEQDFPHGKGTCHCFQFSQERRTANLMECISHMEEQAAVAEQEEEDEQEVNESDESLDASQILYEPWDLGAPRMCCSKRKRNEAAAAEQDSQHEKAAEFDTRGIPGQPPTMSYAAHTASIAWSYPRLHSVVASPMFCRSPGHHVKDTQNAQAAVAEKNSQRDKDPQHQEHALRVEDTQPDTQGDQDSHKTWTPRSFSWSSPQEDQDTQDSMMVWPDTQGDQDSQDSVEVLLMDLPDTCTGFRGFIH